MLVKLSEKEADELLNDLCIKLGFCLPPPAQRRIAKHPPSDLARFANVVYRAEGLDPGLDSNLYRALREQIARAFQKSLDKIVA